MTEETKKNDSLLLPGLKDSNSPNPDNTVKNKLLSEEEKAKLMEAKLRDDNLTQEEKDLAAKNLATDEERDRNRVANDLKAREGKNPPVAEHGRVQDTNLTNQNGQPLENSKVNTGDTGVGNPALGLKTNKDGILDERIPTNLASGTTAGDTVVDKDHPERMEDRDRVVIDRVSGNPVLVQGRVKEDKREEFKALMDRAHDSLDGAKVGEIGLGHPFHGLMERARQFGKAHGLI